MVKQKSQAEILALGVDHALMDRLKKRLSGEVTGSKKLTNAEHSINNNEGKIMQIAKESSDKCKIFKQQKSVGSDVGKKRGPYNKGKTEEEKRASHADAQRKYMK